MERIFDYQCLQVFLCASKKHFAKNCDNEVNPSQESATQKTRVNSANYLPSVDVNVVHNNWI